MTKGQALHKMGLPAGIRLRKTFRGVYSFEAYYAARDWCRDHGVSYGSMQRNDPIGLAYGDVDIAKWPDIPVRERRQLDGVMIFLSGGSWAGPVEIWLRDAP